MSKIVKPINKEKKAELLNAIRKKQRQLEGDWAMIDIYGIQLEGIYKGKDIGLNEA
jgi:hypothetical protein